MDSGIAVPQYVKLKMYFTGNIEALTLLKFCSSFVQFCSAFFLEKDSWLGTHDFQFDSFAFNDPYRL